MTIFKIATYRGLAKLCLFLTLSVTFLQAQNLQQNNKKYWDYRDRLIKYFVKIGPLAGEGMPATTRNNFSHPDNQTKDTIDFATGELNTGVMKWGDNTAMLGWYIGVLATEYKIKKDKGEDTWPTLTELYYAITAVNRLDLKAEPYLNATFSQQQNGFFVRDDIYEGFVTNWEDLQNSYPEPSWGNNVLKKKYHYSTGDAYAPSTANPTGFNLDNRPSQDQAIGLLMGFGLVKKFVDNVFVRPTTNDAGFYVVSETQAIASRILGYWSDYKQFNAGGLGIFPCTGTRDFKRSWTWTDPTTHKMVAIDNEYSPNSVFDFIQAYPLGKLGNQITGTNNYSIGFKMGWEKTSGCGAAERFSYIDFDNKFNTVENLTLYDYGILSMASWSDVFKYDESTFEGNTLAFDLLIEEPAPLTDLGGYSLKDIWEIYGNVLEPNGTYDVSEAAGLDWDWHVSGMGSDVNFQMALCLAAMTGTWNRENVHELADGRMMEVFKLLYDVMNGHDANAYKQDILDILNVAPCDGSVYLLNEHTQQWMIGPGMWDKSHRWLHPNATVNHDPGRYNMVDYMLLHNLYMIAYSNNNEPYNENLACPCYEKVFEASTSTTATTTTLNPRLNNDYQAFGRYLEEYIQSPLTVSSANGKIQVNTGLAICNNTTVTVQNNANILVGNDNNLPGRLTIRSGSKLLVKTTAKLKVNKNSAVIVKAGGELILEDGSLTEVGDSARIIVEPGGILRYHNTTSINLIYATSVLDILGTLHLQSATFAPAAPLVYETTGSGFTRFSTKQPAVTLGTPPALATNVTVSNNNCQMNFSGVTSGYTKKLEVADSAYFNPAKNLMLFTANQSAVELGTDAYLNLQCRVSITNSTFDKLPGNLNRFVHGGIKLYGQSGPSGQAIVISGCHFHHAKDAIRSYQTVDNTSIRLLRNRFKDCKTALYTVGQGANLTGNTFTLCDNAWIAHDMTGNGIFEKNSLKFNTVGIGFLGFNSSKLIAGGNEFVKNGNSISAGNAEVTLQCNDFKRNGMNLSIEKEAFLNMSTDLKPTNLPVPADVYGGYNNFDNNWEAVRFHEASTYDLHFGFNNFDNTTSSNGITIQGQQYRNVDTKRDVQFYNNAFNPALTVPYVPYPPITDLLAFNDNSSNKHFALLFNTRPDFILGTVVPATNTNQCPVFAWRNEIWSNENPNGNTTETYMVAVSDGVLQGMPLENPTATISGGFYHGSGINTAFESARNLAYNGNENGNILVNVAGLERLQDLLIYATGDINWKDARTVNRHYLTFLAAAITAGDINGPAAATHLSQSLAGIAAMEAQNNLIHSDSMKAHYQYLIHMDKVQVYKMFNDYTNAIATLNVMLLTAQNSEQALAEAMRCYISNEKMLYDELVTPDQYARLIEECRDMITEAYNPYFIDDLPTMYTTGDLEGWEEEESSTPEALLSYVLSPNPASSFINATITVNASSIVEMRVYDKFGVLKYSQAPEPKTAGVYNVVVPTSAFSSDVYTMIVLTNGTPQVKHFVVAH